MRLLKKIFIQPKSILLIFAATVVITIGSVLIELNQSKSEMLKLMEKHGETLLESMLISSKNALLANIKFENELRNRLLDNATYIKILYENKFVNNSLLNSIAKQNNIYRVNIFNKHGEKIFSSSQETHQGIPEKNNPQDYLHPIFNGDVDTLIIGIKQARFLEGKRFAVAIALQDRGAVVLNVDADELLQIQKETGFGPLLLKVVENKEIIFAVLQDEEGIIAGAGKTDDLESIDSSEILKETLNGDSYQWRTAKFDTLEVFEALHPFVYDGNKIGLFRLGISTEPLKNINERLTRRIIFLGIILFVFGFITITLIFVRQNFDLLSKKFTAIEKYSTQLIENVSEGIIVIDSAGKIKSLNNAAEKLLIIKAVDAKGKDFINYFAANKCEEILRSESSIIEIDCVLDNKEKVFLVSKSDFINESKEKNTILLFKDLTELKLLEKQIHRNERLAAMGELASSVAHEIRNPLNSIGTIAQQLKKDFQPVNDNAQFMSLTDIVYKEVKRINEIINNFLKFARPQPIKAELFLLSDFLLRLEKQFSPLLKKKKITLSFITEYSNYVFWDRAQMLQVFINLLENALDVLKSNGSIDIITQLTSMDNIKFIIRDNGYGIAKENINRIFDLYFTTKTKGNGIGLSIVQKIIAEHNGTISVKSELAKGTEFTIIVPRQFK